MKALETWFSRNDISTSDNWPFVLMSLCAGNLNIKAKVASFWTGIYLGFIGNHRRALEHGNRRVKLDVVQPVTVI
jgi:hypothetical protein